MKNTYNATLGFESPTDFFTTLFGWHYNIVNGAAGMIAVLTTFITSYIWDSSSAVYALLSLMLFDWVLGVYLSIRATILLRFTTVEENLRSALERRRFSSKKFPRIFVAIPISFWILSTCWNLSKSNIIFYPLPGLAYGGFAGTYLMSLWENLTEMGFFSKDLLVVIKERFNITKYFNKSHENIQS